MNRYHRHTVLPEIGEKGQRKLLDAKVLVIGAGGLGCPILQYLCAAGVGTLGIVDHDTVDKTNLQRQVLFGTSSLGKNKALEAKKSLENLNNTILIEAYPEKLKFENVLNFFTNYDIIVDGTDNFTTRYLINDAAIFTKKPLVYGAIYKFEGQVSVFNYKNGPSYRCLFPTPPEAVPNCSEIGVLGVLPGIIGSMQANEVLKIILEIGNVLTGKIAYYNALTTQMMTLDLEKSSHTEALERKKVFENTLLNENCEVEVATIPLKEALQSDKIQFIDVRNHEEKPLITDLNCLKIPLIELENNIDFLKNEKVKMIFCQSGMRSKKAVALLKEKGIENCFSLTENGFELQKEIKSLKENCAK